MSSLFASLARKAIGHYLKTGKLVNIPRPVPEVMSQPAGVFVSLHEKNGSLRGCIGTFLPTKKNIAEEIIANAVAAAIEDPRFPPVRKEELPGLKIKVDVLSGLKLIKENFKPGDPLPKILNPKKYGLIVSDNKGRKGLLLPDIPGVTLAQEQLEICLEKGGIFPQESVNLEIFTVKRYN